MKEDSYKSWTVKPDCYNMINEIIGSNFSDGQIEDMLYCEKGLIVYRTPGSFFYRNITDYKPDRYMTWNFIYQFDISIKTIRKNKLIKINLKNGLEINKNNNKEKSN